MIRRLARDRRAMAAVEFAMTLPFLIVMFVGCYQFSDAIMVYRKLTRTARTIADLTAQNTSLASSDVDAILSTSTQVMTPYDISSMQMTVVQVKVDGTGNGTVDWGRSKNATVPAKGASVAIPTTIGNTVKGGYIILSNVKFTYTAKIASAYFGNIPLSDTSIMLPRGSAKVDCPSC